MLGLDCRKKVTWNYSILSGLSFKIFFKAEQEQHLVEG